MRRAYPTSFCFQEMIEIILKGFFTASFSRVRVFFLSIYCSHSPIPIRPFFARAGLREEKPAPFTKIVKSAAPQFWEWTRLQERKFLLNRHSLRQVAGRLANSPLHTAFRVLVTVSLL